MISKWFFLLISWSIILTINATTQRGIYVSIFTDHVGIIPFTGNLTDYSYILGNTTKESNLISWLTANSFTCITLYSMNAVFNNGMHSSLKAFILKARAAGITRIEAVGGSASSDYAKLISFHQNYTRFDGFVTEVEFWNGDGTIGSIVNATAQIRAANLKDSSNNPLTVTVYIGWPMQSDIDTLVSAGIDRFNIHAYTKSGVTTYNYASARLDMIKAANQKYNKSVAINVIFSAEGSQYNAPGDEPYMGDWLQINGIQSAETNFESMWKSNNRKAPVQIGFQYYQYFFLKKYLSRGIKQVN